MTCQHAQYRKVGLPTEAGGLTITHCCCSHCHYRWRRVDFTPDPPRAEHCVPRRRHGRG